MSAYEFEIVDANDGVVRRWASNHSCDEQAVAAFDGVELLDGEGVRVFRAADSGPFACRDELGVEVFG